MEKTNIIENALELLKKELEVKHSNKIPSKEILDYLIKKAEDDEDFSKRVLIEKKSFKECLDYVFQEVRKLLMERKTFWLDDPEVYGMAEDYYISDDVKFDKPEPRPVSIPKSTTTKSAVQSGLEKLKAMSKVEVKEQEQITLFGL